MKESSTEFSPMPLDQEVARHSRHLRLSLKRGLARQALSQAQRSQASHAPIFDTLRALAPNRRAMQRAALRLRRRPGVTCAGLSANDIVLEFRNACTTLTRSDGHDLFSEETLIYTRVTRRWTRAGTITTVRRVSFGLHALERLVERSDCALSPDFLRTVDAEAGFVFRSDERSGLIEQDGDEFLRARANGVWAGSLDRSPPEPEWRFRDPDARIPIFSARTFLGPDEMKPCLWLKWQDNRRLAVLT